MYSALTFILLVIHIAYSKPIADDMLLYWRRSGGNSCEPFTTFKVNCNKCVCAADGVTYCTRMLCRTPKPDKFNREDSAEVV